MFITHLCRQPASLATVDRKVFGAARERRTPANDTAWNFQTTIQDPPAAPQRHRSCLAWPPKSMRYNTAVVSSGQKNRVNSLFL